MSHFAAIDERPSFLFGVRPGTFSPARPPPAAIVIATANYFGVKASGILSSSRYATTADARHVAMWLCRSFGASYPEIGIAFGRDHSTVMSGVRKVDDTPRLRADAAKLRIATSRCVAVGSQ